MAASQEAACVRHFSWKQREKRLIVCLVSLLVLLGTAGCVISDPFPELAIADNGGKVQVYYTSCKRVGVKAVVLIRITHDFIDGSEPVLWRIDFPTPADLTTVGIGSQPAGAQLTVPLTARLDSDVEYDISLDLTDGRIMHTGFYMNKLNDGKVRFEEGFISRTEFLKRAKCLDPKLVPTQTSS